ncbi:MAG: Type 1 glutamine amidotransferase-like domain-containing protein [Tenericutes bacterium]|nr:Type 1 glutamine amidotransferase-like domain-containing protein [Mycoplasmatota bacterium]
MANILLSRGILHHPNIYKHVKEYIKANDRVLVVAFSFFESQFLNEKSYQEFYSKGGEYYEKMIDTFSVFKIAENQIEWLNYYQDNHDTAVKKIKQADIIYFPGGAPDLMMKRIKEFDIKEALESHHGLFIGSSAGSMIQFKQYHISPDGEYHKFSYEEGLNLLSGFFVEVHYRRRNKQKSSMRKVHRAYQHDIYAIPDDGAIIADQKTVKCIGSARKIYDQKGICRGKRL